MRVLITGITGFVGSHLAEYALAQGAEVVGCKRWRSSLANIEHILPDILLLDGDLTDPLAVRKIMEKAKAEWVFHLAAQSFVKCSFDQPRETMNTNVLAEINLLHGVREGLAHQILVTGSSEEYGEVLPNEIPINENNPLRPLSPYGVSKVAQDLLGYQYFKSYGLNIIRTRAFNHTGPRRGDVFAESNFAKQIIEIELLHKKPIIETGNLEAIRDYTDVRDMVRAYWMLMLKGKFGEVYNIASGAKNGAMVGETRVWKMCAVLSHLLSRSPMKELIEVVESPDRMRPSDVPVLIGDYTKIWDAVGWVPLIPIEQTLDDILNYWRMKIGGACVRS